MSNDARSRGAPRTTVRRSAGDEPPASRLTLVIMGESQLTAFPLPPAGDVSLGRLPSCDVHIDDPSISRRHAVIHMGPPITVEDAGSANGTRVRGRALLPNRPVPLAAGDVVEVGDVTLVVQGRSPAPRPRRVWPHGYFEARLEDECARAARRGEAFGVLHIACEADVTPEAVLGALAELTVATDVVGEYGPRRFEALLTERPPEEVAAAAARLGERFAGRVRVGHACYPGDGLHPDALLARAAHAVRREAPPEPITGGMSSVTRLIDRMARGMISVLILGETGVGKEVVAERIHRQSPRAGRPFLRINCAALSELLLESELFGHERGAFTGAVTTKAGLLETADGGTVFLDEVGELPPPVQAKLLRVLEERKVMRVGALKARPIDVRFVSATNRDLEADSAAGRFRQDLYFRLNGVTLFVPPLRERRGEIEGLAREFLVDAARQAGLPETPSLARETLEALRGYPWPGNIRELRNTIERAALLCTEGIIRPEHLPLEKMRARRAEPSPAGTSSSPIGTAPPPRSAAASSPPIGPVAPARPAPPPARGDDAERRRLLAALDECAGNQTVAAKLLGVSRRTFLKRLDRYGVKRPRKL